MRRSPMSPRSKSPRRWKQSRTAGHGATPLRRSRARARRCGAPPRDTRRGCPGWRPAPACLGHGERRMRHGVRGDDSMIAPSRKLDRALERSNACALQWFDCTPCEPPLPSFTAACARYASVDGRAHRRATDRLERRRSHPWSWSGSGAPCRRCRNARVNSSMGVSGTLPADRAYQQSMDCTVMTPSTSMSPRIRPSPRSAVPRNEVDQLQKPRQQKLDPRHAQHAHITMNTKFVRPSMDKNVPEQSPCADAERELHDPAREVLERTADDLRSRGRPPTRACRGNG